MVGLIKKSIVHFGLDKLENSRWETEHAGCIILRNIAGSVGQGAGKKDDPLDARRDRFRQERKETNYLRRAVGMPDEVNGRRRCGRGRDDVDVLFDVFHLLCCSIRAPIFRIMGRGAAPNGIKEMAANLLGDVRRRSGAVRIVIESFPNGTEKPIKLRRRGTAAMDKDNLGGNIRCLACDPLDPLSAVLLGLGLAPRLVVLLLLILSMLADCIDHILKWRQSHLKWIRTGGFLVLLATAARFNALRLFLWRRFVRRPPGLRLRRSDCDCSTVHGPVLSKFQR